MSRIPPISSLALVLVLASPLAWGTNEASSPAAPSKTDQKSSEVPKFQPRVSTKTEPTVVQQPPKERIDPSSSHGLRKSIDPIKQILTPEPTIQAPEKGDHTPPPWIVYTGVVLALLTFLYNVIRLAIELRRGRTARRISVIDDYWFREMLMPLSIEPLIDFIIESAEKLRDMNRSAPQHPAILDLYNSFHGDFLLKKEAMISRLMLLIPIDHGMYKAAAEKLDDIEDIVSHHCYAKGHQITEGEGAAYLDVSLVVRQIYQHLNGIITSLIKQQHEKLK